MEHSDELEELRQRLDALFGTQEEVFAAVVNLHSELEDLGRVAEGDGDDRDAVGEGGAGGDDDESRSVERDDSGGAGRLEDLEDLDRRLQALAIAPDEAFAAMAVLYSDQDAEGNRDCDCVAEGGGDSGDAIGEGEAGSDGDESRYVERDDSGGMSRLEQLELELEDLERRWQALATRAIAPEAASAATVNLNSNQGAEENRDVDCVAGGGGGDGEVVGDGDAREDNDEDRIAEGGAHALIEGSETDDGGGGVGGDRGEVRDDATSDEESSDSAQNVVLNPNELERPPRDGGYMLQNIALAPYGNFMNAEAAFNFRPMAFRRLPGENPSARNLINLPFDALDRLWRFMPLTVLNDWVRTCTYFNDHVVQCYPLWSRISRNLMNLTSNVVFDFENLQLPAADLYALCRDAMAELSIPPALDFQPPRRPSNMRLMLRQTVIAFRVFPDRDYLAVLFSDNWFEIHPLSRLCLGQSIYSQRLDPQWSVRDFFVYERVVFWLDARNDWTEGASLVSRSPNGGGEAVHSLSTDIIQVTCSEQYLIALERRSLVVSEPGHTYLGWSSRRYQMLLIYPKGERTYATEPCIRQVFHPIVDIKLDGTNLATLWYHNVSFHSAWEVPRPEFAEIDDERAAINLGYQDLGPPASFKTHAHISVYIGAHHRDSYRLARNGSLFCQISLIDRRTPFYSQPPALSGRQEFNVIDGKRVVVHEDYMRIGRFVVSPTSHGQFYHLAPASNPRRFDAVWTYYDVSLNNYVQLGQVRAVTHISQSCFAGRNLIYLDNGCIYVQRIEHLR